ncbi:uncharacterized protein B0I36DRAFT_60079 [Microdochium trichocladiopsis]|uniref:Uncharacterized protein n=1 Tax=Microdochium trichocladiopsis TaxID=1682393 RepID=A0A9P9BF39_9PEZI|nr:uncharacterized protein B0I36DRAFT_60079 [Microdochium trichocladiopsis]KAH7009448.1 hypothetical protein B0I36DRAFT_60079 [Microdochium trichocladiopsis]
MPREVSRQNPQRILEQIGPPTTETSLPGTPARGPHLHLLTLPPEIRHLIWTIYYREVDRPWYRYAVDVGHEIEYTRVVPVTLTRTCKQLLHEITPFIYRPVALDLHIVYPAYWPEQIAYLPSREARQAIDHVIFHVAQPEHYAWSSGRPPKRPVKFYRFPNLADFTVCVPLHVPVEELTPDNPGDRSPDVYPTCRDLAPQNRDEDRFIPREVVQKAQDAYSTLADTKRVALWRDRYSAQALLDADVDEDEYEEDQDGDYEGQGRHAEDKDDPDDDPDRLARFQAIAARLRVMVEFELWATADAELFESGSRQPPKEIDERPLLLRLDPRRREIVEIERAVPSTRLDVGYERTRTAQSSSPLRSRVRKIQVAAEDAICRSSSEEYAELETSASNYNLRGSSDGRRRGSIG